MKKILLIIISILLLGIISFSTYYLFFMKKEEKTADDVSVDESAKLLIEEDMIHQEETLDYPSWIPQNTGGGAPWYDDLYYATSDDGMTFEEQGLFLPHSGVGHLLLTQEDELIATFQYFSYENEELFDKIAYSISGDYGITWSPVKLVNIGMPNVIKGGKQSPNAVDPTLIQLEDGSFRLYFTYEQPEDGFPQLYSATSDSIDGYFKWEGKQLTTEQIVLDPAVVFFDNMWHHYTTRHEDFGGETVRNVHSTSEDGLSFERQDDIEIGMSFLGDVIEVDGGLRFYGGQSSSFSEDGYTWTMDEGRRLEGADPGVAIMPDGTYIAIYTGGGK
ncbi:MAG: hypothetical protein ABIC57_02565 [bacterium]